MLDKKGIMKAMLFAVAVFAVGLSVLTWQYQKLDKVEIPRLEEEIEKNAAYSMVQRFMDFRTSGNETRAEKFLTEVAMEEKQSGTFDLVNDFNDYQIIKLEKLAGDTYRFLIEITESGGASFIEAVSVVKILDHYYIDSVELAG